MQRKADRPKRNVGYIANNNRAAEAATEDPLYQSKDPEHHKRNEH
jgi:hypothetical protein